MDRTFIRTEPGTWVAWVTQEGHLGCDLITREFMELPYNGFIVGYWKDEPDSIEINRAYKLIAGKIDG